MSEIVFNQEGLRVIRFCGIERTDGGNPTRYELIRDFDKHDILGNSSMTISADQMAALIGKFKLDDGETGMPTAYKDGWRAGWEAKEGEVNYLDRANAPSEKSSSPAQERVHPEGRDGVGEVGHGAGLLQRLRGS